MNRHGSTSLLLIPLAYSPHFSFLYHRIGATYYPQRLLCRIKYIGQFQILEVNSGTRTLISADISSFEVQSSTYFLIENHRNGYIIFKKNQLDIYWYHKLHQNWALVEDLGMYFFLCRYTGQNLVSLMRFFSKYVVSIQKKTHFIVSLIRKSHY